MSTCRLGSEINDEASEDLDTVMQRLMQSKEPATSSSPAPEPTVEKHPEVIDDFIRNFLVKMGLSETLEVFESEWCALNHPRSLQHPHRLPFVVSQCCE